LSSVRLATVGPATSAQLAAYRLNVDCQPARFQAEDLAEALSQQAAGKRFLLARASRGREVLAERLRAAGGDVTQVVVYRSVDVTDADPEITRALAEGRIDWITVTSSAIGRSLARLFPEAMANSKLASISPLTSDSLRQLGFRPSAEAEEATIPALISAIAKQRGQDPFSAKKGPDPFVS